MKSVFSGHHSFQQTCPLLESLPKKLNYFRKYGNKTNICVRLL